MGEKVASAELKREILASAKRMLDQLNQIELSQESDLPPGFGEKSHELLEMISHLQTEESENLLLDVSRWGEDRKRNYSGFEDPLLRQVEDNQSITTEVTHESIPRMQSQMDTFQDKLDSAKTQLATMGRSVLKEGQRVAKGGSNADFPAVPILQLESNSKAMLPDLYNRMQAKCDEDEALIKQMKMREEHFMAAVQSLGKEVELLSSEVVEVRTYNLELEDEVRELKGVIEQLRTKAGLSVCPGRSVEVPMDDIPKVIVNNLTFEIPIEGPLSDEGESQATEEEDARQRTPVVEMRAIENFHFDIAPEELDEDDPATFKSKKRSKEALGRNPTKDDVFESTKKEEGGFETTEKEVDAFKSTKKGVADALASASESADGVELSPEEKIEHDKRARVNRLAMAKYAIDGEIVFESVDGKCQLSTGPESKSSGQTKYIEQLGKEVASDLKQIMDAHVMDELANNSNEISRPSDRLNGAGDVDATVSGKSGGKTKTGDTKHEDGHAVRDPTNSNANDGEESVRRRVSFSDSDISRDNFVEHGRHAAVNEESAKPMVPIGIRQKENKGFRIIYRDNNDAVIVDTEVKHKTKDGLFIINHESDYIWPAIRIRDGFASGARGGLKGHNLALKPISRLDSPPKAAASDFLAVHEERMKRIAHLKQTLVGLFEIGSDRPIDSGSASTRTAMRWSSFPVRPPPPLTRAFRGRPNPRAIHVDPELRYPGRSARALFSHNKRVIAQPKMSKYQNEPKSARTRHVLPPLNGVQC